MLMGHTMSLWNQSGPLAPGVGPLSTQRSVHSADPPSGQFPDLLPAYPPPMHAPLLLGLLIHRASFCFLGGFHLFGP